MRADSPLDFALSKVIGGFLSQLLPFLWCPALRSPIHWRRGPGNCLAYGLCQTNSIDKGAFF